MFIAVTREIRKNGRPAWLGKIGITANAMDAAKFSTVKDAEIAVSCIAYSPWVTKRPVFEVQPLS